jgi:hypothetical protein
MSGAVSSEKLGEALHAVVTQGIPLARALVGLGAIDETRLEEELARSQPQVLRKVVPISELMDLLPPGLCHRLAAAPVRLDERSGAVEVAVLDARDTHPAIEIAYHLHKPTRAVRASYSALREALEGYPIAARALAAPMGNPSRGPRPHTPLWGTPVVVLDEGKTASDAMPPSSLPPPLPNSAIPLMRRVSGKPPAQVTSEVTSAMSPVSQRSVESIQKLDDDDVRFATRAWENTPTSEPGWAEEVYWDIEPVFPLTRLGPPPTVPEPEPPTIRMSPTEELPPFSFKAPAPARVPIAVNAPAPPYPDVGTTLSSIRVAETRDAVLALVQGGVRAVARRVALLVVKKEGMAGWSCTPEFGDESALKQLRIPIRAPNLLTAVLSGSVHLGPLMGTFAAPLLRVMPKPTHDVAMAAVRVGDRPAVLIVADELGDTLLATKRIDELARAAGDALLRILRSKKE